MADIYIFIVGLDGNLWRAEPPFGVGHIPPKRVQVDTTVQVFGRDQGQDVSFPAERSIFVFNQNSLMVLGSDLNLWLEHGPFGKLPWVESTLNNSLRLPVNAGISMGTSLAFCRARPQGRSLYWGPLVIVFSILSIIRVQPCGSRTRIGIGAFKSMGIVARLGFSRIRTRLRRA